MLMNDFLHQNTLKMKIVTFLTSDDVNFSDIHKTSENVFFYEKIWRFLV